MIIVIQKKEKKCIEPKIEPKLGQNQSQRKNQSWSQNQSSNKHFFLGADELVLKKIIHCGSIIY